MKFEESAYDARIADLFTRFQSVQQAGFVPGAYKPGLEGMRVLDSTLGHPWRQFRCIHVAGTNGKGSVSSMLASALAAQGFSVGLYTSPHLLDFRERIKLVRDDSFSMIPKEDVWDFLERYETALDGRSFFEISTGMALWWFAREKVDFAVVEAGLGGRLDSTNIISPVLSVITSIGLDHCAILGGTRAEIAAEKAGIFKKGAPAIVSVRDDETAPVFKACARKAGSTLTFASDYKVKVDEESILADMDLQGPCQRENLHTCLAALAVLEAASPSGAASVPVGAIIHTAARTGLRGRWERLKSAPETICDIAHNPPALKLNFSRLEEFGKGRPLLIVFGMMADKDLAGIAPLMPADAEYILAAPHSPRALPAAELAAHLKRFGKPVTVCGSIPEGVESAREQAGEDGMACAVGSLYMAGAVRACFGLN